MFLIHQLKMERALHIFKPTKTIPSGYIYCLEKESIYQGSNQDACITLKETRDQKLRWVNMLTRLVVCLTLMENWKKDSQNKPSLQATTSHVGAQTNTWKKVLWSEDTKITDMCIALNKLPVVTNKLQHYAMRTHFFTREVYGKMSKAFFSTLK